MLFSASKGGKFTEKYTFLQICTLTITWPFRKSPPGSGMWTAASRTPSPPLFP